MSVAVRALVAMALLAVLATASASPPAQERAGRAEWKEALRIRSVGLNRIYRLGDFVPSWRHALRIRSEGLNRGALGSRR